MCWCLFDQFTGIWLFKGTVACDCFLIIQTYLGYKTREWRQVNFSGFFRCFTYSLCTRREHFLSLIKPKHKICSLFIIGQFMIIWFSQNTFPFTSSGIVKHFSLRIPYSFCVFWEYAESIYMSMENSRKVLDVFGTQNRLWIRRKYLNLFAEYAGSI